MSDILTAIMEAVQTGLVTAMYTDVDEDDVTRVYADDEEVVVERGIVIGRILDDPEVYNPHIEILPWWPDGPFQGDGFGSRTDVLTICGADMIDMRLAHQFIISGYQYFTRMKPTRLQARTYAGTFRNRLRAAILANTELPTVEADGERIIGGVSRGCIQRYYARERGGPPREWIWECHFLVQYETERVA